MKRHQQVSSHLCGSEQLERVAYVAAAGFLSRYPSGPLPYV